MFASRLDRIRIPLRLAYVGIILLATLSSLHFDLHPDAVEARFVRMLRPEISGRDVVDGARNLALFIGWGLVWMVTAAPGRSRVVLRNAVVSGAALSLTVEGMQLLSDTRNASSLDLATNTGGAAVGALILVVAVLVLARASKSRSFVGIPAAVFGASYAAAVLAETFVPLFRGATVIYGSPLERLSAAFDRFSWSTLLHPPFGDFLTFLPAGAFGVAALHEGGRDYREALTIVGVMAVVVLPAAEVAHGGLGIPIHAGAALIHALAVVCGAALAARYLASFTRNVRGPDRPRVLTLAYVAALVLWAARPYDVERSWSAIHTKVTSEWWVPLRSLGMRMDMFSVVDVCAPFLLYLPLGALLAVWPLRLRGRLAGFAPALYLAFATEFAQTVVAQRTLDLTDFMIQASGAAVGWISVRRAGFRQYGAQLPASVPVERGGAEDVRVRADWDG
jgi:glycopeptide antibiotics resistance protein